MTRGRKPPPRRVKSDRSSRSAYILVEGAKTERQYITAWHRLHRRDVKLTFDPLTGCDPLQLVTKARDVRKQDLRDERRERGTAYDQYWCVFDRDEHANWPEALQMAADNGISLAISNPCIEVWFLVHFEAQTAWLDRSSAQSRCRVHISSSKALSERDFDLLHEKYATARSRAQSLEATHVNNGNEPHGNPSSGLWRLIDVIAQMP